MVVFDDQHIMYVRTTVPSVQDRQSAHNSGIHHLVIKHAFHTLPTAAGD